MLQCRSTAPLHSRSVRGDELKCRSSTPTFGSITKLQHSFQTTHGYIEADLAIKEQALQKLAPAGKTIIRFKADDALLTFLASL